MPLASAPPPIVWPLLLATLGAGCAAAPPLKTKAKEGPLVAEASGPGFVTPAHWAYHPSAPESSLAWVRFGTAGCVFTSEGGQRWVTTPATDPASTDKPPSAADCAGKAEVSSS